MQAAEIRDSGTVLGTALDETAELARDVHRAVAGRLFGLLGAPGAPIKRLHDGIAALAYGATRLSVRVVPRAVGAVAAELRTPTAESVDDHPRAHFVLSALGGWAGDRMEADGVSIAPRMRLRTHDGRLRGMPSNVVARCRRRCHRPARGLRPRPVRERAVLVVRRRAQLRRP